MNGLLDIKITIAMCVSVSPHLWWVDYALVHTYCIDASIRFRDFVSPNGPDELGLCHPGLFQNNRLELEYISMCM